MRVSTSDQNPDIQRSLLVEDANLRGWTVADVFVEHGERGHVAWRWRPEMARMMQAIRARRIDVVMVTRVHRFYRNVQRGLAAYSLIRRMGCHFVAVKDRLDTTICDPHDVRHGVIAKLNQAEEQSRERSGTAQDFADYRRVNGLPVGRRRRADVDWREALRLRLDEGLSYREIARQTGVPRSTLWEGLGRILDAMGRSRNKGVRDRNSPGKGPGSGRKRGGR